MAASGTQRLGAMNCVMNSLRLRIAGADPASRQLTDVQRRMEIVRLGQGVDATGRLSPDALARTFAMLGEYARAIADSGAAAVRLVATSATRDASNAEEFTAGVQRILSVDPEVVTGADEAYLSFFGATAELGSGGQPGAPEPRAWPESPGRPEPPFLVVAIGGGSTEFVFRAANAHTQPGPSARSVKTAPARLTQP